MLVFIVLGGIYSGIFTPTEAAAVAAVYAFFITVFVYRDLKLSEVPRVLLNAANMSAMLLYIITNAVLFSFLMTHEQIPQAMAAWILDQHFSVWVFLLVVNIILLMAGNVMDPSSILLIMAPILFPLAVQLGVNPIHLRDIDGGEYGSRPLPPAGRAQSLRRQRHSKNGHQRNDDRGSAVARRNAAFPGDDHLRPDHLAVAAANPRSHAVAACLRL